MGLTSQVVSLRTKTFQSTFFFQLTYVLILSIVNRRRVKSKPSSSSSVMFVAVLPFSFSELVEGSREKMSATKGGKIIVIDFSVTDTPPTGRRAWR